MDVETHRTESKNLNKIKQFENGEIHAVISIADTSFTLKLQGPSMARWIIKQSPVHPNV